jgi:hypothetical protein
MVPHATNNASGPRKENEVTGEGWRVGGQEMVRVILK